MNMSKIVFAMVQKQVPVVCYMDNETLWTNLMNITAHSLPELACRCREAVYDEIINSICLIKSQENPSDSITKGKDNGKLTQCLKTGYCVTTPTQVFMLQLSKFRDCSFILACTVPMKF